MGFSIDDLRKLDYLLKQVLDLPLEARESWFTALGEEYAYLHPTLRELLLKHGGEESDDLVDRLPAFTAFDSDAAARVAEAGSGDPASIGPYRLIRELGRGGMGAVWLAERIDGLLKRPVAVKFPHIGDSGERLSKRFARERDILAGLAHPNIARLYDAGITQFGQPYIALEFVEGVPLTDYCDSLRLNVRRRLELFLQVLSAVQYAHAHLVVHRDLKPSNILVTADGQVRLLDFGIARLLAPDDAPQPELTVMGDRALTPDYASPEQIAGQPIGTASDVYSLGIVLYELLVGSRPYRLKRDSRGALEEAILTAPITRPSAAAGAAAPATARGTTARKLSGLIKGDLDVIVAKALKKASQERYSSVEAFAQDLRRHIEGLPVLAQADSLWYRSRKFALRHTLPLTSLAIVLVALIAGLGIALWQARVARAEAATATAMKNFMVNIFRTNSSDQPDPIKARATTSRELLDIAAKKLDPPMAMDPAARLAVLETLTDMFANLRLLDQAAALSRQRLQLLRKVYGGLRAEDAEVLVELANYVGPSEPAAAKSYLGEAQQLLDQVHDQSSELRAKLDWSLAQTYANAGQTALAQGYAQQAVQIGRQHLAAPDPDFPLSMRLVQLGQIFKMQGKYAEAEAALAEALSPVVAAGTKDKSHQPTLYWTLGNLQYLMGQYAQADSSFRAATRVAREIGGPADLEAVHADMRLGGYLGNTSRINEALAALKDGMDRMLKLRGTDDSIFVPWARAEYGRALGASGRMEEAHALMLQALDTVRRTRAKSTQHAAILLYDVPLLIDMGNDEEASAELLELTSMRSAVTGELLTLQALDQSKLLLATGKEAEAEEATRAATATSGLSALSPAMLPLSVAKSQLALAQGDFATALALAYKLGKQIDDSGERPYLDLWAARVELIAGKAALADSHADTAEPLLEAAVARLEAILDPASSLELADAYIALAAALSATPQTLEARRLVLKARAIQATHVKMSQLYLAPLKQLADTHGRVPPRADFSLRSAGPHRDGNQY